jgi:hypothetical protein
MQDQESGLYRATRLFERAVILVFSVMGLVTFFYIAGNYQNFTDRTQLQLLTTMQSAGGMASIGSVIGVALELVILVLYRRVKTVIRIALLLLGGGISLGITIGSSGLLVFLGPV